MWQKSTDGETVRVENSIFIFEYISEGGIRVFVLTSSFLWAVSVPLHCCWHTKNNIYNSHCNNIVMFWQHKLKKTSKPEHSKPTSGVLLFHKNKV